VANEAHRKFCRECGEALRCSCLSCQQEIPVWDKVCFECGGKQVELAVDRTAEMGKQRERAEQLRAEYEFESALAVAEPIAAVTDKRIAGHAAWAQDFVASTKAAHEQAVNTATRQYEEAKKHREVFDYATGIRVIKSIPVPMRTPVMIKFLQQLENDQEELNELLKTIRDRVARRDLEGLVELTDRALKLDGNRADLQKLHGQLLERKKKEEKARMIREAAFEVVPF
jgi:hypothetical protein